MEWAVEYAPPMPAQLVATLIGLANHADAKGRATYPSLARLAAYTCKAERSVRRDLRDLEALGLIRPGNPARTAHLPTDKRPAVYDLALEKKVAKGRAGADEGTRASARTLASSRARGGKKKPSSDEMREDVGVRPDVDVPPDAHVTSGGTWASQRGDVGVRQTVIEPSDEPKKGDAREDRRPLADQIRDGWWERYGHRTAQGKRTVHAAITEALDNGLDPNELWDALVRLGDTSKPVTGGTLQFALSDVRKTTEAKVVALRPNPKTIRNQNARAGYDAIAQEFAAGSNE